MLMWECIFLTVLLGTVSALQCGRSAKKGVLDRESVHQTMRLWAEEITKGESGELDEGNTGELILERNRHDLWKQISILEKEAVNILKSTSASEEELHEKKVETFKLLSKSVGLKKRDTFQQLVKDYASAEDGGKSDDVKIVLTKMREVGLPPHIASLVETKRNEIAELETQDKKQADESENETSFTIEEISRDACESETVTEKIRVKVHTFFDKESSDAEKGQYMFWYKVAIYNECSEPVQIVARMWELEKLPNMEKEILRGTGVLQTQPIISPGDVFAYESKCPIKCFPTKGKRLLAQMSGAFTACRGNMGQHNFPIKVSKFSFVLPESEV